MSILEKAKGYRTFTINAVLAVVGLLVAFGLVSAEEAIGAETIAANFDAIIGGLAAILGVVNVVLRTVTNTPPGKSN